MSTTYGGDNITFPDGSTQNTSPQTGFTNRIINGAMTIDQRNAGAALIIPATFTYALDRFYGFGSQASKFYVQQNAGSVTPPSGFKNYLGAVSYGGYSVGASETFIVGQTIEGFNIYDLGWGAAGAQPVTLSFWVRSSQTGTFGGALRSGDGALYYPFSYTISTADTWTQISVSIVAPTTGVFNTGNTAGFSVYWSLGSGSTVSGTAGAWTATAAFSVTGAQNIIGGSVGAYLYITGVQLEKGSTATPFEFRSIGQELALCQRYYTVASAALDIVVAATGSGNYSYSYSFPVEMRATPTLVNTTISSNNTVSVNADNFPSGQSKSFRYRITGNGGSADGVATNAQSTVTANAEL